MEKHTGIRFDHVQFHYPHQADPVLQAINWQIPTGSWVSLLGNNGSGKSTLLKLLVGLEWPQSGTITINGQPVQPITQSVNPTVGMVFQDPDNQFVGATVADDVAFGLANQDLDQAELQQRVRESLQLVEMETALDRAPDQLSGGQKQRVAVASVMARRPAVLLLDEVTSMLDPQGRQELITQLHQLHRQFGITVIEVTHQPNEAMLADEVVVLHDGKIAMQGKPTAVLSQSEQLADWGLQAPLLYRLRTWLATQGYFVSEQQAATSADLRDALWQLKSKI
ncbi:energy-coupling factor transporter ATPase [Fructilactobacillus cliffordii]|uniref:energy-coupling factor transporter ATPase n=1 Tax=Fructilactobacillus cliffordii TaxID=2940299 RepID=UPI0020928334|nr:energy-coupling factor transporter ATPase [Fructilactobacillus cliffordii]USS86092.1 energy-coupling factor transporter ATPase [Fructilactobacillus cliffordii]